LEIGHEHPIKSNGKCKKTTNQLIMHSYVKKRQNFIIEDKMSIFIIFWPKLSGQLEEACLNCCDMPSSSNFEQN